MAPAEQLRHQPWRRARPSAILAPSSRTPPPKIPHSGRLGGARTASGPRALGQNSAATASSLFGSAARAWQEAPGWDAGPRRGARARPARPRVVGGASEPGGEARERPGCRRARAGRPAGPGPAGAGGRLRALAAAARRSGGKEEARMKKETRSPPPPLSPPSPLPLPRRGVHFAEKKENAIHTQELPKEKRNEEGKTEGRRLEKLIFLPRPPSLLALPAPCSRPCRAVLPSPSPAPSFPAPGGSGGRKTHSHSLTQLILNRLNQ